MIGVSINKFSLVHIITEYIYFLQIKFISIALSICLEIDVIALETQILIAVIKWFKQQNFKLDESKIRH